MVDEFKLVGFVLVAAGFLVFFVALLFCVFDFHRFMKH